MIKQLKLKNFKCFRDLTTVDFKKVNLVTGVNGRGKSTLLQALLLLSQSAKYLNFFRELVLKGDYLTLGTYDDVRNNRTVKSEPICFRIETDDDHLQAGSFFYKENELDQLSAKLVQFDLLTEFGTKSSLNKEDEVVTKTDILSFAEMLQRIHFVSADRMGPVNFVEKTSLPSFINVGARGQHTLNILANSNSELIPLVHDNLYRGGTSKALMWQTAQWLSYILDGARLELKGLDKESSVLYMLMTNQENLEESVKMFKPTNIGFGYSYILPMIVTGLIARPGDIVVVENPEAHLHPRAQARIAEFFAILGTIGVQVFIESHSEHILNGLRVATLNPQIPLQTDELSLLYFSEDFSMTRLEVEKNGRIANWPSGFFDQQQLDLAQIFKLTRNPK